MTSSLTGSNFCVPASDPVTGEPVVQVLLQSCALVEYNGKRWLGVHPLVIEFLKDLGYDV